MIVILIRVVRLIWNRGYLGDRIVRVRMMGWIKDNDVNI